MYCRTEGRVHLKYISSPAVYLPIYIYDIARTARDRETLPGSMLSARDTNEIGRDVCLVRVWNPRSLVLTRTRSLEYTTVGS